MRSDERPDPGDVRITDLLREVRQPRFRPGFADRVTQAVAAGREARSVTSALPGQFLRLAPVALALIAGLFVYNVWIAGSGRLTLEDALGLAPVTIEEAYSLEVLLRDGESLAREEGQ